MPELTLTSIALDLDAPRQAHYAIPTPRDHIAAYEAIRRKAYIQLAQAQTDEERADAHMWIDNADRNISRWQLRLPWGE